MGLKSHRKKNNSYTVFKTAFLLCRYHFSVHNCRNKHIVPLRDVIRINSVHEAQEHTRNKIFRRVTI
jgi:hypothetical protein